MSYKSKFTGEQIDEYLTRVEEAGNLLEIKEGLAEKADKDGHYPEFTSGFADNLVGRGESIPAEFSFRASGGKSIEDGTARIKTLKGNAVVWNQLRQDRIIGDAYTYTNVIYSDGILNIGGATKNYATLQVAGDAVLTHYYYIGCNVVSNNFDIASICSNPQQMLVDALRLTSAGICQTIVKVNTETSIKTWRFVCADSSYVSKSAVLQGLKIIDLTQMFGAGNEPTTIEEFNARKPIVEDENAYNEGEVIPFTAEEIKSVGDNAWDEEWEVGTINTLGNKVEDSTKIRSKNFCKIISGETYNLHCKNSDSIQIVLYDKDYQYKDYFSFYGGDRQLMIPQDVQYFMLRFLEGYGKTYNNDVSVSLVHSGYKEGKYFPYEQDIRKIDSRILEAFPNGMMPWDKVYNKNGKGYIVKGTGVVDMGSLTGWGMTYIDSYGHYTIFCDAPIDAVKVNSYDKDSLLCSKVATQAWEYMYRGEVQGIGMEGAYMRMYIDGINDAESAKAYFNGIPLYYELAEPTIIEYDEPFNLDYLVWDFGTEEIIADKPSAPLKADIIYQFNAVDEIRELRQLIATMQAQLASLTSNNGGQ